jgi:hypothetical protein
MPERQHGSLEIIAGIDVEKVGFGYVSDDVEDDGQQPEGDAVRGS